MLAFGAHARASRSWCWAQPAHAILLCPCYRPPAVSKGQSAALLPAPCRPRVSCWCVGPCPPLLLLLPPPCQVMDSALEWLRRERAASELSIMLVLGLPNSGKSSLINACKLAATKQGVQSHHNVGQHQP